MSGQAVAMSDYRRPRIAGATIFFTVCLARRGSSLLVEEVARLREAVRATHAERPFHIDAWVILPDHLHAVWTLPEGDSNYGVRWGAIKSRFVTGLRRAGFSPPPGLPVVQSGRYAGLKPGLRDGKREQPVWQRRYWDHHIRDEADFAAHLRYCWINPVRHGLVEHPMAWPHSSIHRDVRRGMVEPEWSCMVVDGAFGE